MWDFPLFPDQASTIAGEVDALYLFIIGVCVFFTTLICFLILFFAVKYRRGSPADRTAPPTKNLKLEAFWITVPLCIALGIFVWSAFVFFDVYNPPRDAFEVFVIGKQWMWKLQHPEGKSEINELHVPLGRPVRLTMTSQDVIHSFFVPAFRMKQDVLPGRYTTAWFEPTRTGRFHLYCTEYCGTNHSGMVGWVTVMEPSEYQDWLERGLAGESMIASGAALFRQHGCSGCHGDYRLGREPSPGHRPIREGLFAEESQGEATKGETPKGESAQGEAAVSTSTVRAPSLQGIYGRQVPIQSQVGGEATFVLADDRYIRDSIRLPKKEIVAGYEPLMPVYTEQQIPEDELLRIIAYIKALGQE